MDVLGLMILIHSVIVFGMAGWVTAYLRESVRASREIERMLREVLEGLPPENQTEGAVGGRSPEEREAPSV